VLSHLWQAEQYVLLLLLHGFAWGKVSVTGQDQGEQDQGRPQWRPSMAYDDAPSYSAGRLASHMVCMPCQPTSYTRGPGPHATNPPALLPARWAHAMSAATLPRSGLIALGRQPACKPLMRALSAWHSQISAADAARPARQCCVGTPRCNARGLSCCGAHTSGLAIGPTAPPVINLHTPSFHLQPVDRIMSSGGLPHLEFHYFVP
jgi:hypothetical protein